MVDKIMQDLALDLCLMCIHEIHPHLDSKVIFGFKTSSKCSEIFDIFGSKEA